MIWEPINYENASVNLPGINQSLLNLEVMLGTFTSAFFENAKTNDWCQCASVLSHLKVLQFRFTYERSPNYCLENLSYFHTFIHHLILIFNPNPTVIFLGPECRSAELYK